jgi:hypothetical protein
LSFVSERLVPPTILAPQKTFVFSTRIPGFPNYLEIA